MYVLKKIGHIKELGIQYPVFLDVERGTCWSWDDEEDGLFGYLCPCYPFYIDLENSDLNTILSEAENEPDFKAVPDFKVVRN